MGMYETIFILDSLLVPEEIDKIIENIKQMIDSNGGKVLTVDKWGKRRLAYEIQKKQYGFYVAIEFEGEGPIPNALEHEYNFNDKILRYLTYRYTKNKMKAREKELRVKSLNQQTWIFKNLKLRLNLHQPLNLRLRLRLRKRNRSRMQMRSR